MPTISGRLITATNQPSTVKEIWVRATTPQANGANLTTTELTRFETQSNGHINFTCSPGPAVLVLVHKDTNHRGSSLESIPLIVGDADMSLGDAIRAAKSTKEASASEIQRIAAMVQSLLGDSSKASEAAKRYADAAKVSETAATNAQQSAENSSHQIAYLVTQSASSSDLAQRSATEAHTSATKAKLSEDKAGKSATNAAESSTSATNAAGQALAYKDAARAQATEATTQANRAKTEADKATQVIAESLPIKGIHLRHLADDVTHDVIERINARINQLVNNAPAALDTFREVADAISQGKTQAESIMQLLTEKLSKTEAARTYATTTQLAGKANTDHTHNISQIGGLTAALAGKVSTSDSRLTDARTPKAHRHNIDDLDGVSMPLAGKTVVKRWANGTISTATPEAEDDAANKYYVDTKINDYIPRTDATENVTAGRLVRRSTAGHIFVPTDTTNGTENVAASRHYVDSGGTKQTTSLTPDNKLTAARKAGICTITVDAAGQLGITRDAINAARLPDWACPNNTITTNPTNTTGEIQITRNGTFQTWGIRDTDIKFTITYVTKN
ncbi:MAG: hypothetical protein Q4A82_01125 [Corynebacterium sp.]|nr:hypothetical protein [Corynebacterium sp.]